MISLAAKEVASWTDNSGAKTTREREIGQLLETHTLAHEKLSRSADLQICVVLQYVFLHYRASRSPRGSRIPGSHDDARLHCMYTTSSWYRARLSYFQVKGRIPKQDTQLRSSRS